MEIKEFIDKLFAAAKKQGLEEYQIIYGETENNNLQVYEQKVLEQNNNVANGLNFAVRIDGKVGRFNLEEFVEENIDLVISEAVANAKLLECEEDFFFYDGKGKYKKVKAYEPMKKELDRLNKLEFLKTLEKRAYEFDERINKVIATRYSFGLGRRIMRNSLGLDLEDLSSWAGASLYVSAKSGDVIKTYGEAVSFDKLEDFIPDLLVQKVGKKAVARLDCVDVASQKTSVVFENKTFAAILGNISGMFSSYNVDTGKSKLKGKIGEKIANEKITIIDNPWLENGYNTMAFDGEGVPTQYKEVVKNGILQTFLYGLSMADKYKTKSTGNGTGGLGTKVFNFYLENGSCSKEELLNKLGNGVYIDKLNGLNGGISIVSGDFSMGAEGFLIENGKITQALSQFTVSGNIYQLLNDVEELGNDLDFDQSPLGSPSVLVKNITIANN